MTKIQFTTNTIFPCFPCYYLHHCLPVNLNLVKNMKTNFIDSKYEKKKVHTHTHTKKNARPWSRLLLKCIHKRPQTKKENKSNNMLFSPKTTNTHTHTQVYVQDCSRTTTPRNTQTLRRRPVVLLAFAHTAASTCNGRYAFTARAIHAFAHAARAGAAARLSGFVWIMGVESACSSE